jgi:hypothetical protein
MVQGSAHLFRYAANPTLRFRRTFKSGAVRSATSRLTVRNRLFGSSTNPAAHKPDIFLLVSHVDSRLTLENRDMNYEWLLC